jgi:tetratricopeptide (TPR) repeat protein
LGTAYTLGGRIADAVPLRTQAMEQSMATELIAYQAPCGLSLGAAQRLAGRLAEACALAARALGLTRVHQERGHQVSAWPLLGDMAARREPLEVEPAVAYYPQVLTLAEARGMRPLQAHCRRGLGRLYATAGQREQARAARAVAIRVYRALEMTLWLPQVEAALAPLESRKDR